MIEPRTVEGPTINLDPQEQKRLTRIIRIKILLPLALSRSRLLGFRKHNAEGRPS